MLDPLRFQPILRRYVWGGRKLATLLGKDIGPDATCAESWEIVDRPTDQSVVVEGPLTGRTLNSLVVERGTELFGQHHPQPRFPLLWKFLDARQNLSVQVHPDDALAARLDPPDFGKTEAWVVLAAEPGSLIYAGLKPGFDRPAFEKEVSRGTVAACLHRFEPHPGDCVFLPAGTVHALGAGVVVAEIQQASDTTFRVDDWDRVGPDGRPRQLHVEQALEAIDYRQGPVAPRRTGPTGRRGAERLVTCPQFCLVRRSGTVGGPLGGDNRFHVLGTLRGRLLLRDGSQTWPLSTGQILLVPACRGPLRIDASPDCILLDAFLPSPEDLG